MVASCGTRCDDASPHRTREGVMSWPVVVLVLSTAPLAAQEHTHATTPPERLGTVNFRTSCSATAQPTFNRAVALLHSFEFSRAVDAFNATLKTDPSCAMAHWG